MDDSATRGRAALISLVVGAAIMAGKFAAWGLTGSTAVLSDALESIVNVVAASFALYSVRLAHTPALPPDDVPRGGPSARRAR